MPLPMVMDELPLAQGLALCAWSVENNPWVQLERIGLGYVGQEAEAAARETREIR